MSASSASRDDERVPDACRECDLSDDGSCPRHPAPKLSRRAADEYIDSKRALYLRRSTTKSQRTAILDDICSVTTYHRDTVKRKLRRKKRRRSVERRGRPRKYTERDTEALLYLREVARFIDSRGLKSQIPRLIEKVEDGGHRFFAKDVKRRLGEISARTIDRRLAESAAPRPYSTARPRGRQRKDYEASLRVRTWAEWRNERPGSVLADIVHHGGGAPGGTYCLTLTVIDAATSWTSLHAIQRLDQKLVASGMDLAYRSWPLSIHAVHTDRGTEFANASFGGWARQLGIEHTLGRPRQSNGGLHT